MLQSLFFCIISWCFFFCKNLQNRHQKEKGMGGDGQSLNNQRAYLIKARGVFTSLHPAALSSSRDDTREGRWNRMSFCPLSGQELSNTTPEESTSDVPIVADRNGDVYLRCSIVDHLIEKVEAKKKPARDIHVGTTLSGKVPHIQRLRDVMTLVGLRYYPTATINGSGRDTEDAGEECALVVNNYSSVEQHSLSYTMPPPLVVFECPVTRHLSHVHGFVVLWACGHVISSSAVPSCYQHVSDHEVEGEKSNQIVQEPTYGLDVTTKGTLGGCTGEGDGVECVNKRKRGRQAEGQRGEVGHCPFDGCATEWSKTHSEDVVVRLFPLRHAL